jgi:tetratricopeptide (TPR) repeat protein
MFTINRLALAIAFLFAGIPTLAISAGSGGPPDSMPEATYHNQKGMQYFKHGYYDLIPRGRKSEANASFVLAEKSFQKAISINSNFVEAHRNLARLYFLEKKFDEAAPHYNQAIKLNPKDLDNYINLSLTLIELGKYDEAIRCLEDAKVQTGNTKIIKKLDSYIAKIEEAR